MLASWAIWLIVAVVLIILEMVTLTFYLLWLGIGAAAAGIAALVAPNSFVIQALVGAAVAVILMIFTKPITRRLWTSRGYKDAIDDLIGREGIVLEDMEEGARGLVKVGSETWSATANTPLMRGDKVIVVNRGTTVIEVHKWGG